MDPNSLLQSLRGHAQALRLNVHTEDAVTLAERGKAIGEMFERLDSHLSGGGAPPAAWSEGPDEPYMDDRRGRTDTSLIHRIDSLPADARLSAPVPATAELDMTAVLRPAPAALGLFRHRFPVGMALLATTDVHGWVDVPVTVVETLPTSPDASGPIYAVRNVDGVRGLVYESELQP